MTTEVQDSMTLGELSADEQALIRAVREGNEFRVSRRLVTMGVETEMSYEQRAALAVIAHLVLEGVIDASALLNSGSSDQLEYLMETTGEALLKALHILGCPHTLTLAQILDRASSYRHNGGAE